MAKLKGMDFKALLLNHGEKLGAVVVGLLALTGLATANWSSCEKLESDLKNIANQTRDQWSSQANAWPQEKQDLFAKTPDVELMAQKMASPNEFIELATVRHWNEPINQVREKLGAVSVLPPEFPEAILVQFPLLENEDEGDSTDAVTETEKPARKTNEDQQALADLFGSRKAPGAPGVAGGTTLPGGAGNALPGTVGGSGSDAGSAAMMGMLPGTVMPPGGSDLGLDMYGAMMGGVPGAADAAERKVRFTAGISVRCVFDLYKQTVLLAEALRISPQEVNPSQIDFVNLEIQRKEAVPGPNPWAGEWQNLPLEDIAEILDRAAFVEREIVNPSVIRSEIVMQLPSRAAGNWTTANASHSRLENFKLSEEEQELIDMHQTRLLEEAKRNEASLPKDQARGEGFRRHGLTSQDLGMTLGNQSSSASESMYGDYQAMMQGGGSAPGDQKSSSRFKNEKELEDFLDSTLVANRLLLVRFMDFTCDRGTSYQYRVRLEMRNPNFGRPVDELEQPELASRPTLFSDWSQPSTPVFVPAAYRYYTQKVDAKPRTNEMAHINMLYLHETAGTPVMANLRVPVGVRIGGRQTLEVVDLAKNTLETQEVELRSQDFLAGVSEAPRISQADFPELKDVLRSLGSRPIPDRITVLDSNGALVSRYVGDSVSADDKPISESDDMAMVKYVLDQYTDLRPGSPEDDISNPYGGGSGSSEMMGKMMGMGMGGMGDEFKRGGAKKGSALGNRSGGRGKR